MGITDRRARHRASLRREILDAASKLFVEVGYDRVTMRRIAGLIEYSPTTIYLHFKNKQELFDAVCDETFAQLGARLEKLKRTADTPIGYLREGLRTYVEFGTSHPDHYTVTFLQSPKGGDLSDFERSTGGRAFSMLRQAVRACVEHGDVKTPDVEMTAQALWAAVHGLTALLITAKGFPFVSRKALIDHSIDTLMAGLQGASSAKRTAAQSPPHSFMN